MADRTAKDPQYVVKVLRPAAKLLACRLNTSLYAHLCCQSSSSRLAQNGFLPATIAKAVFSALEKAMLLKAELIAAGDEVAYEWLEPGVKYDKDRMSLVSQPEPIKGKDAPGLALPLLPQISIWRRGKWALVSRPIVSIIS